MSARARLMKVMSQVGKPRKPKPVVQQASQQKQWNIVRGDKVQVVGDHPERGKQGEVLAVLRKQNRVVIKGVNVHTQHVKGNPDRGIPGRSVDRERSLPYRMVNLLDPVTNQPTRVTRQILEDGTKVRVAKKSGAIIPRPEILRYRRKPINSNVTESDSVDEDVWEQTYFPDPDDDDDEA